MIAKLWVHNLVKKQKGGKKMIKDDELYFQEHIQPFEWLYDGDDLSSAED